MSGIAFTFSSIKITVNIPKRKKLIVAITTRPEEFDCKLNALKKEGKRISELNDWLWYELLCSMSTLGNSRGYYGLMLRKDRLERVTYNNLLKLKSELRLKVLIEILGEANIRRHSTKAKYLASNIEKIESFGGLQKFQNHILALNGKESKMNFIATLKGIGVAYSRNIFMDLYHDDFINSIKIDHRLKQLLKELEADTSLSYCEYEEEFISIATDAKVTPWELDRLLYNYKDYFIAALR
jgi:hypothetical protein